MNPCAHPKPVSYRYWAWWADEWLWSPVVCDTCGWLLSLREYEQGGRRMRWWIHHSPPIAMAA